MEGAHALESGTRILIADEARHSRGLLAFLLRVNGYQVTEETNGREALSAILKQEPHLVLLEALLPGRTGFEICAFLKQNPHTCRMPVILMASAAGSLGGDEDSLRRRCSADECLMKPFTLRELLDRIEKLLAARTAEPA